MPITTDLRFPIGKFTEEDFSEHKKDEWISDIRFLPNTVEAAIQNLDEEQLQTPYREGGWTVHQLVHHMADSHMNAFIRFKLGITEDVPDIKPYNQDLWVHHADVRHLPVNVSLTLLHALHQRWYEFLKSFTTADWERKVFHPEHKKEFSLWDLLGMYSWHGRHHTAHITSLRDRMGW